MGLLTSTPAQLDQQASQALQSNTTKPTAPKDEGGFSYSGADTLPEGGKGRDKNRHDNHKKEKTSKTFTGSIELRGFPTLRAKKDIHIANVGALASGDYYVESVTHQWSVGQGYRTTAKLIRSGDMASQHNPMVMFADMFDPGTIWVQPRPIGKEIQTTFTYGEGEHLISFSFSFNPQPNRAGCEGDYNTKGGLSPAKPATPTQKEAVDKSKVGPAGVDPRKDNKKSTMEEEKKPAEGGTEEKK